MKRVVAMLAVLGVLVIPVLVSAQASTQGETRVPPEAKWTPTPPTPPTVAVEQPRTVSTAPGQTGVRSGGVTVSENIGYLGYWDPAIPGDE
jgi:hypothetical protein